MWATNGGMDSMSSFTLFQVWPYHLSSFKLQQIIEYRDLGMTWEWISKKLNIHQDTVFHIYHHLKPKITEIYKGGE